MLYARFGQPPIAGVPEITPSNRLGMSTFYTSTLLILGLKTGCRLSRSRRMHRGFLSLGLQEQLTGLLVGAFRTRPKAKFRVTERHAIKITVLKTLKGHTVHDQHPIPDPSRVHQRNGIRSVPHCGYNGAQSW